MMSRRLRTGAVLKAWIEDHFRDFDQDAQLSENFLNFVRGEMKELMGSVASQLEKSFEKRRESFQAEKAEKERNLNLGEERTDTSENRAEMKNESSASSVDWMKLDPQIFAEHMTLLESHFYCSITPNEVCILPAL